MRIDAYLYTHGFAKSRTHARTMIEEGLVYYDGKKVVKPSVQLSDASNELIEIRAGGCPYVSRGGLKLQEALEHFKIDVHDLCALDIGASTGGFTDCLLQYGARKIYAVDSGKAQMAQKIRFDERVVVRESCNARYLKREDFSDSIQMAVMDVSFISQTLLFPAISDILTDSMQLITLIKPQFEVGRSGIGRGGIVRDERLRREAVDMVCESAATYGLKNYGVIESPITGGDGNREFLAYFRKESL